MFIEPRAFRAAHPSGVPMSATRSPYEVGRADGTPLGAALAETMSLYSVL